jgi:hypothetical protein
VNPAFVKRAADEYSVRLLNAVQTIALPKRHTAPRKARGTDTGISAGAKLARSNELASWYA